MPVALSSPRPWGAAGLVAGGLILAASSAAAATPTFSKDVAPILFKSCVECHRPSAMAPMSLLSYEDARPWARAIKLRVSRREMPPWGADQAYGKFANDPSLTSAEIDTIAAWVDGGAPEGHKADLPPAPAFIEGWSIGKPDHVFTMLAPFNVPADGTLPYLYVTFEAQLRCQSVVIRRRPGLTAASTPRAARA